MGKKGKSKKEKQKNTWNKMTCPCALCLHVLRFFDFLLFLLGKTKKHRRGNINAQKCKWTSPCFSSVVFPLFPSFLLLWCVFGFCWFVFWTVFVLCTFLSYVLSLLILRISCSQVNISSTMIQPCLFSDETWWSHKRSLK